VPFEQQKNKKKNGTNKKWHDLCIPKISREITIASKGKMSIVQGFTSLISIIFSG
jgi:hypothetical protein